MMTEVLAQVLIGWGILIERVTGMKLGDYFQAQ